MTTQTSPSIQSPDPSARVVARPARRRVESPQGGPARARKSRKGALVQSLVGQLVMTCLLLPAADAERGGPEALHNWPQWRGPLGTGVAPFAVPPVEWSETRHVRWKTALPGKGHSTPVVWGERI